MKADNCNRDRAPVFWACTLPFLNSISVGALRTAYRCASFGSSSMFTLAMRSLPWYCTANSSRIGAIILHGAHHSAQ